MVPTTEGYEPLSAVNEQSTALPAAAIGVTSARDASGSVHVYAGTAARLYELGGGTWTNATRLSGGDYTTSSVGRWHFAQYKDLMVATNAADTPQVITMSTGANFAALGGSPPSASYVTAYSGFLFLGATATSKQQIRWSAIEDPTSWTEGVNQAGSQTFEDGGEVRGFAVTDVLYVFQEYAIRRVAYVGPPQVFQIDVIERGRGPINQGAIAQLGADIFYMSRDGFYRFDGQRSQPIGAEQVDEWFRDKIVGGKDHLITSSVDPYNKLVAWGFVSVDSPAGIVDTVLIHNWAAQRWSYEADTSAKILSTMLTLGFTLEELDALYGTLDAYPAPLDDPSFIGGSLRWGCITHDDKVGFYTGTPRAALIETGDFQINSAGRAITQFVAPMADVSTATVQVGARERQSDVFVWSSQTSQQASGRCAVRRGGRFHRVRIITPADAVWTHINAFDISAAATGSR